MKHFVLAIAMLAFAAPARAAVPTVMSYQGVLTDNSGTIVPDGLYDLTFRIWDVEIGGLPADLLYCETHTGVPVTKGGFSVVIGQGTVCGPGVQLGTLAFNAPYWLEVQVNLDPPLSPRVPLTSAPYTIGQQGTQYRYSGTLNGSSINATTAFAKIGDFVTITKQRPSSSLEVIMNSRVFGGSFAGGAVGVQFEVRVDDAGTAIANRASINTTNTADFVSILGVFLGLAPGPHTVSVWARTTVGTSTGVGLDPGGWGGKIIVKEVP